MDRVLNHRGGVRPSTVNDIRQAIADLDEQASQLRLNGRVFMIDIVMQTPARFSAAVKTALEHELPSLRPAVVRSRFDFRETGHPREIASVLDTIARRGSRGVSSRRRRRPRSTPRCCGWPKPAFRSSRWSLTCRSASGWPTSGWTTGRPGSGGIPHQPVAGRAGQPRPRRAEPHRLPRRGGTRDRLPVRDPRAVAAPRPHRDH